jgi:hypothetical protein
MLSSLIHMRLNNHTHPPLCHLQVKSLALAETEAASSILGKAEKLIKSLAQQREAQRERERQVGGRLFEGAV